MLLQANECVYVQAVLCARVTFIHWFIRPFIEKNLTQKREEKKSCKRIEIGIPLKWDAFFWMLSHSLCVLMEWNHYLRVCVCGPVLVHGISRIPLQSNPIQFDSIQLTQPQHNITLYYTIGQCRTAHHIQSIRIKHMIRVNVNMRLYYYFVVLNVNCPMTIP